MNKLPEKILNFKDFLVVDYTQQAGTNIDPDGYLAKVNANSKKYEGTSCSAPLTKKKDI
tara:strand:+ start:4231 stop:4407 length:177 start_codon:yes stop_codon:yes gene_type:complete